MNADGQQSADVYVVDGLIKQVGHKIKVLLAKTMHGIYL